MTQLDRRAKQKRTEIIPIRTAYGTVDKPVSTHQRFSDVEDTGLSMTKQADMAECDINNIMKRYETTGVLPDLIKQNPQYGEFADAPTYQESLHLVQYATEQFQALSAKVRARFDNDPATFLAFAGDARNLDEMETMGLLSPDAVTRRQAARIEKERAKAAPEPSPKGKKAKHDDDTE